MAVHGSAGDVPVLLNIISQRPASGAIVPHAMRIAVKRLLQNSELADQVLTSVIEPSATALSTTQLTLASILPAVGSSRAAESLLSIAASDDPSAAKLRGPAVQLACKHMRPEFAAPVVRILNSLKTDAKERPLAATLDEQSTLALDAFSTLRAGGQPVPAELQTMLYDKLDATADAMISRLTSTDASKPLTWQATGNRAWQSEDRKRPESDATVKVISSLPLGEAYTGIRASETFPCPASLTFLLCGHDGPPNMPALGKNLVRLVQT